MKNKTILLILTVAILLLTALTGCSNSEITITFDANGGTTPDSIVTEKVQLAELPESEREGYVLEGWYFDKELTKPFRKNSLINEDINSDITVYAKWLKTYTVQFDSMGGSAVSDVNAIDGYLSFPRVPTKNGFVFEGWYTDLEYTTVFDASYTITSNMKVYARWLLDEDLTVRYYDFDGKVIDTQIVRPLATIEPPTLLDTDKYTFVRWSIELARVTESCNIRPIAMLRQYDIKVYKDAQEVLSLTLPYGTVIDLYKPSLELKTQILQDYLLDEQGNKHNFLYTVEKDIKLFLQYEPKVYKVNYQLNGGINSSENPDTITAQTVVELKDPTREGYTFKGWYMPYKYQGSIVEVKFNKGSFKSDVTFYAKWANDKNYAYYLDGESCIGAEYLAEGESLSLMPKTKDFYNFSGWYIDSNLTQTVTAEVMGTETKFLYSKWTPKTLAVNYSGVNGADFREDINPTTFKITEQKKLYSAKYIDGYEFKGWYLDSDFTKQITELNSTTITVDGDITLYARFEPKDYTVTYNISGSVVDTQTYKFGQKLDLLNTAKKGYELDGWYTDSSCTTLFEQQNMPSTNLNLYAKWKAVEYTVTYMDGTRQIEMQDKKFTIENGFKLSDISKEGYIFDGWYKDLNFSTKITEIESGIVGDMTIYAKFTANRYTLSYYDGNILMDKYTYSTDLIIPEYTATTKEGYTFDGWYLDENFESKWDGVRMPPHDLKLYGKWTLKQGD